MLKISDKRKLLRSVFGPLVLMVCIVAVFAALIYGYTSFQYESEWPKEQKSFEKICANVSFEEQRLKSSAGTANLYSGKYTLGENDVYAIIAGFLNKTMLTVPTYTFMWVKSQTFLRMYEHGLMFNDDTSLTFNKPSTKIVDIVFRSALPIFATFAVGCGVSALHSIVTTVLKVFIRHKKHEAWTVGRNRMLRINVMCSMVVALVYFAGCFVFSSFALSKWQDVAFTDGIKMVMNIVSTIPPDFKVKSVTDAHTVAAFNYFIQTATSYVIFCTVLLIKTWRISSFAIPMISDIDGAYQVDKDMQSKYRKKRDEWFQRKPTETKEKKEK